MNKIIKSKGGIITILIIFLFNISLVRAEDSLDPVSPADSDVEEPMTISPMDEGMIQEIVSSTDTELSSPKALNSEPLILPDLAPPPPEETSEEENSLIDDSATTTIVDEVRDVDVQIASGTVSTTTVDELSDIDAQIASGTVSTTTVDKYSEEESASQDEGLVAEGSSSEAIENNEPASTIEKVQEMTTSSYDIPTSIIRDETFARPTVLAQWQMVDLLNQKEILGKDDSEEDGAQILPSGQYQVNKEFSLCALVADGLDDINKVSSVMYYPKDIAFSEEDSSRGCGSEYKILNLSKIDKNQTESMVCDVLRLNNNNLLSWNKDEFDNYTYSYNQVCGSEGFLAKEKASLYCATTTLAYDDPAGDYVLESLAVDTAGEFDVMQDSFKYMELTNIEYDFEELEYGMVSQNEIKYLSGDNIWGNAMTPTVRNTGNTRVKINIWQNDFNLGKTENDWNVKYMARIGNASEYVEYYPEETSRLNGVLELGDIINLDLTILISDFPKDEDIVDFSGKMTLTAEKEPELLCEE